MPSKIGISCRPWRRPPQLNRIHDFDPPLDVVQSYETEQDALNIETRWKKRLKKYSLDRTDEIFWIKAGELMRLIEEGSPCRQISSERVRAQKKSVFIPNKLYYFARMAGPVGEVMTEALQEYLDQHLYVREYLDE